MTEEEQVSAKALLRAMMEGIDLAHDLEGHVHLKFTVCPYCQTQSADFGAAKLHDATCEKHPAVIRLAAREKDIERAIDHIHVAQEFMLPAKSGHLDCALAALESKPEVHHAD